MSKQIDIKRVKRLLVDKGERGWSVAALAKEIGHTRQSVHNILTGRRPYSVTIVPKIAAALGVPINKILLKPIRQPKPQPPEAVAA